MTTHWQQSCIEHLHVLNHLVGVKGHFAKTMNTQKRKKMLVFFGAPHTTLGYLGLIADWLRRFELRIFVVPWLSNAMQRYDTKVYSSDSSINAFLTKRGFARILQEPRFGVDRNPYDSELITHFAKTWYRTAELKNLLTFKEVNLGTALESDFMFLLLGLTEKMRLFQQIIEEEAPHSVRAGDMDAGEAQALRALCASHKIDYAQLCPGLYERSKMFVLQAVKCARNKTGLDRVGLFGIASGKAQEAVEGTILIDAPYPNYLGAIFPVVEQLLSQNLAVYFLASKADLRRHGRSFKKVKLDKRAINKTKKFNKAIKNYTSKIKWRSTSFQFNGMDVWPLIAYSLCYARALASYLERFDRVASKIRPDLLLVGDDTPAFVRTHAIFAQKSGIPVVEVQHGIYLESTLSAPHISDKICLWGSMSRDVFIKAGVNEDRLEITGSPKSDHLVELASQKTKWPLSTHLKAVLFATQPPFLNLNLAIIRKIGGYLLTENNVSLTIKPHPAEDARVYRSLAKEFPNRVFVKKGTDNTHDLLLESDALIVVSSSVAIDAAILNKPIICFDPGTIEPIYVSEGIAVGIQSLEELIGSMLDVLYNAKVRSQLAEARARFVYEFAYLQDGKASERVADVIRGVMKQ